ncbi:hypothetical protein VFPFJ_07319 [Purpureocillium lilacinum]|uniref:Uncharacterized protein n=1 Tax=Purpureocillium lilacinum TaxID=33203 RepID=A0A179HFR8_PURLI|nr:hypothetical protein VFPFJ_07319 [Purpureocillium lilacinum]OAQ88854.1 hypothetical protein VFPFJ_07319 [Purpureocillium lilacinum]
MTQLRCSSIDPYTGHHRRLNAKIRPLLSMRVHEHIRYVSGRFVGSPAHAAAHQQQPRPPTATEAAAAAAAAAGPLFSCGHCDAVLAIHPAAPQAQALVEVGGPPCPCEIPLPCAVPWHALSYLQAGAGAERVRYGERLTMNRRCAASNSVRHAGGRNGGRHSRQLRTAEAGFLFSDDETHTRTPAKPPMPRPWLVAVFHAPPFHLSASTSKPRPALLGTAWPDQLHHRRRPWTGLLAILRTVRSPRNFISTEDIAVASLLATVNKRVEMYQCSAVFFFFSAFLGRPRIGTSHSHRRYDHASTLRTSVKPPIACRENRWRNLGGEDGLGRQRKQVVWRHRLGLESGLVGLAGCASRLGQRTTEWTNGSAKQQRKSNCRPVRLVVDARRNGCCMITAALVGSDPASSQKVARETYLPLPTACMRVLFRALVAQHAAAAAAHQSTILTRGAAALRDNTRQVGIQRGGPPMSVPSRELG